MFKKFIVFCISMILVGVVYAPPPKKVKVEITPIGDTVLLKRKKDLEVNADEEEKVNFKARGVVDNGAWEIPALPDTLPIGSNYDHLTGIFEWTPTKEQSGSYSIIFKSRIYGGKESKRKVKILVFNNIFTMRVGETWNQKFKAIDPDKDFVVIMIIMPPRNIQVKAKRPNERSLTWTPTISQVGIHEFPITAVDFPKDENGTVIQILQKKDIRQMKITVEPQDDKVIDTSVDDRDSKKKRDD